MPRCGIMVIKTICNMFWMCHIKKKTLYAYYATGLLLRMTSRKKGAGALSITTSARLVNTFLHLFRDLVPL
jgi:hypothetical protein